VLGPTRCPGIDVDKHNGEPAAAACVQQGNRVLDDIFQWMRDQQPGDALLQIEHQQGGGGIEGGYRQS